MSEKTLELVVQAERKLFYSEDTSYGIFAVTVKQNTDDSDKVKLNEYGNVSIKGSMPELEWGKNYKTKVKEVYDKRYGLGYEVVSIYMDTAVTKDSQEEFLKTILTKKQVEEIMKVYKDDNVVEMIEEDTFDYNKVHGLGEKTYEKLKEKVLGNLKYRNAIIELSEKFGITHNTIKKLSDEYGSPDLLIKKVNENPYILAHEVKGIGFKKSDQIALSSGIEKDSPNRIGACVHYILSQNSSEGHTWMPKDKLVLKMVDELSLGEDVIREFLNREDVEQDFISNSDLTVDNEIGYLDRDYNDEITISDNVKRLLEIKGNYNLMNIESSIQSSEEEQGFSFTEEQKNAIELAIEENVIAIVGKAGTGKSSIIKGIMKVLSERDDLEFSGCALSGKASQRIEEITGLRSSTIHRLLKYNPQSGFTYNQEDKLPHDVIIVDEFSMVNSYIASRLIRAIKDGAKLILVGDVAQLPPIGAGNCLVDIINSKSVPVVELTKVHRQAQKSGILSKANEIRGGIVFDEIDNSKSVKLGELKDLWYYPYKNKDNIIKAVVSLAEKFKGGNILDFQVITSMKKRGQLSTNSLNKVLQDIFNPDEIGKASIKKGDFMIRVGDKVIQQGNNYDLDVYNGTLGIVRHIEPASKEMVIEFEGRGRIEYDKELLKDIDLAYALTTHKCQGSQFKHVVSVFDYSAYMMLSRQLVYTSLTRAQKTLFLIAEPRALKHGIKTDHSIKRNTFLEDFLKK